MSSLLFVGIPGFPEAVQIYDTTHPTTFGATLQVYDYQNLPTEPVGFSNITFANIHAGSEIHIYRGETEVVGTESAVASQVLSVPVFPSGYNTLRILIVSLGYEVMDFNYAVPGKDSSIAVFQRLDRNYRNP